MESEVAFDVLESIHKACDAGFTHHQSIFQARQLETLVNDKLVKHRELKLELLQSEARMKLFIIRHSLTMLSLVSAIVTILHYILT